MTDDPQRAPSKPGTFPRVASPSAEDILQATAKMHADHRRETAAIQRLVDRVTGFVGQPGFVVGLALVILGWILANLAAAALGDRPADPAPFVWLQGAISTAALFVAALILTTQRREDQLAGRRDQLILELTILNDQKSSKIIALLEEVRRDNPTLVDRIDRQADAMSTPSDTLAVLGAIKDIQDGAD